MYQISTKLGIIVLFAFIFGSCAKKSGESLPVGFKNSNLGGRPPSYVQKAWDARYSYDADRRLLVPEYAGSRWGAVQQFKEEGHLVYQDWWVRDVRKEELEESPDTKITSFLDEDGNLTQSILFLDQNTSSDEQSSTEPSVNSESSDDADVNLPDDGSEEDPFEPSPFLPF